MTESQDFLCLDNQQVVEWICRDDVAVSTEDVIFKAIVRWIQHCKSERKGKFEELFRYVRLSFISRDYLLSDVLANDLVSGCSNCLKLAKDAAEGKCSFQSPRNRPFPSSKKSHFQSEAKCEAIDMKMIFNYDADKTHFNNKGFALSLVLKVRCFGTRKWPIGLIHT